ncbi:hypothetical protein RR48_05765 [Papilio machaon]|uniref:Metallothionein n=1 Tax=Papilio machaon TaxID=76193 RepID=A0A0N1II10_PAPMA|nr:hypothetical protein RR48_05765 [Papilio machaon]
MPCGGCGDNCKCTSSQCCQTCKCDASCSCNCKRTTGGDTGSATTKNQAKFHSDEFQGHITDYIISSLLVVSDSFSRKKVIIAIALFGRAAEAPLPAARAAPVVQAARAAMASLLVANPAARMAAKKYRVN